MKITLVVSYSYPPLKSTTYRTFYIFNELKKLSGKSYLITSANRRLIKNGNQQIPQDETVLEAKTLDYRTVRLLKSNKTNLEENKKSGNASIKFYKFLNSFPFNILFGEGGIVYILSGYRIGKKLLNKVEKSLVISSFRPYSDHIIAYLLKRKFANAQWVADFRDLHLDPQLKDTIFPRFQAWCNRKILAKADLVTTVSYGLAEHLKPFHEKIVVLRNGIGELPNNNFNANQTYSNDKFTINYTGSMFRDLRKPDLLLEALSTLISEGKIDRSKIMIQYAGKDTVTWSTKVEEYRLNDVFRSFGNISHEAAMNLQYSASINLLLTYASPELKGNATGKLYEYLAARRPILLLINGCKDEEIEEVFAETNAGLIAYYSHHHIELVKEFIIGKYQEWLETGSVKQLISSEKLAKYQWGNMMKSFIEEYCKSFVHAQP